MATTRGEKRARVYVAERTGARVPRASTTSAKANANSCPWSHCSRAMGRKRGGPAGARRGTQGSSGDGRCGLLDHLVRPLQERRRDRQAERTGGTLADDQLEASGLLHRKPTRSRTLEDIAGVAR